MRKDIFTNEFVLGWLLMVISYYLMSEARPYSATLFNIAAMALFCTDIVKKFKNRKNK